MPLRGKEISVIAMNQWTPISYGEFYDVPRIFRVTYNGQQFLFDCPFDDDLDDYPTSYRVYLLPSLVDAELKSSWEHLPRLAKQFLGTVAVSQVQFDATKRNAINPAVISELMAVHSFVSKVA